MAQGAVTPSCPDALILSVPHFLLPPRVPTLRPALLPKCQKARPALLPKCQKARPCCLGPGRQTTVADAVNSRAPTQPTHRTRAPLQDFADVRSRMAMESQRQQRHAAAASHHSADSGSSVFLLRVRISYPSSSTLPHHCDSTSPGLLGVDRSSTVSPGSDPRMSGVCGLSVLETHRISRATRTANVMSLFVFCDLRVAGGGELRCPLSCRC